MLIAADTACHNRRSANPSTSSLFGKVCSRMLRGKTIRQGCRLPWGCGPSLRIHRGAAHNRERSDFATSFNRGRGELSDPAPQQLEPGSAFADVGDDLLRACAIGLCWRALCSQSNISPRPQQAGAGVGARADEAIHAWAWYGEKSSGNIRGPLPGRPYNAARLATPGYRSRAAPSIWGVDRSGPTIALTHHLSVASHASQNSRPALSREEVSPKMNRTKLAPQPILERTFDTLISIGGSRPVAR